MDHNSDNKNKVDSQIGIDLESKQNINKSDNNVENAVTNEKNEESSEEKKEDEEEDEEEEEEEEDRIIEKSPNLRFHKRNKKYMRKVPGIDSSYIAIEPKSGKEVFWNEINVADKKTEQENRFISLIKKLKRYNHPFFVRYLDVWSSKGENNSRKIIFVTERLTDPTMKQYFVNSSSTHRLTNKALWRKFVGQLMSVLKFLNHLGVNHGNLSNETVYYQNTGCLKVGTLAVDLNFDNKPSNDIYDMGKLALEMAAYEAADDAENLATNVRIQKMLSRVTDVQQSSFIQTCLDNSESPTTLNKLFQHTVLKEVPSLKRLAAKVIVLNTTAVHEDGKTEEKAESQYFTGISNILKDQVSHFEEETVLFKVVFKKESIVKLKLWKEFRVNFANLTKYIEDVKNGFYPIFEGKDNKDDDDDISYSYSIEADPSKDQMPVLFHKDSSAENPEIFKDIANSTVSKPSCENVHDSKAEISTNIIKDPNSANGIHQIDSKSEKVQTNQAKESTVSVDLRLNTENLNEHMANTEDAKLGLEVSNGLFAEGTTESYDDADNEDDEDEDDDDDENRAGGGPMSNLTEGRSSESHLQPYWEWVSAPNRPPADRALFTGCRYSYVGCGRWQLYVQVWFLEDRLKREVLMQLCEHEWSRGDSFVTELFEKAHVIPPEDRQILQRILSYARHNCPLIDGELHPPMEKLASFNAYDLYQRLEHLQMFSKAQEILEKAELEKSRQTANMSTPDSTTITTPDVNVPNPSHGHTSTTTPHDSSAQCHSNPTNAAATSATGQVERRNSKSTPSHNITNTTINNNPTTDNALTLDKSNLLKGLKIGELPGFKIDPMDIRILAPLNSSCMYCDNHDYLHVPELPAFLSSPCYHCRETLAREAKISPSALFDLHQQNFIPWPAFLQVRFNIPPVNDGRTLKQLIDYDCKWRGRVPCRCLVIPSDEPSTINGLMPPCVEFPNLYGEESQKNQTGKENPVIFLDKKLLINVEDTRSSTNNKSATTIQQRPCSTRHSKGATMTCVHGYTFPRIQMQPQQPMSLVPPLSPPIINNNNPPQIVSPPNVQVNPASINNAASCSSISGGDSSKTCVISSLPNSLNINQPPPPPSSVNTSCHTFSPDIIQPVVSSYDSSSSTLPVNKVSSTLATNSK